MATIALTCLYNDRPEDKSGWQLFHGRDVYAAMASLLNYYGFMPSNPIKIVER